MSNLYFNIKDRNSLISKLNKVLLTAVFGVFLLYSEMLSQINQASPANWLFPEGNSEATRFVAKRSDRQSFDSITIKWSTSQISGDVRPLIGNVINNEKLLADFPYAPNEIVATIGDSLFIIGGDGKLYKRTWLPNYIKDVSCLFDTLAEQASSVTTFPVVLGLETIEHHKEDSLVNAYIAGFDPTADTVAILSRLAIDMRPYSPNIYAGIKPIFGRREGEIVQVYATVNIAAPFANDDLPVLPSFFRGITQFNASPLKSFPLPDVGDNTANRITIAPEVGFAQPSITALDNGKTVVMLPSYPTPSLNVNIDAMINGDVIQTYTKFPYLFGLDISSSLFDEYLLTEDLSVIIDEEVRPVFRAYFIDITDGNAPSNNKFILLAESYKGIEGSTGQTRLLLKDKLGNNITVVGDPDNPPFAGGMNHIWTVAIGNVDGSPVNEWGALYPNNPGNELIVSMSSRDFDVANNKIMILRYNSSDPQPKPSPPNTELFPFDTIATQRINGWIAAVNDIDGTDDLKDEILVVDGNKLMALRLKNYSEYLFRIGRIFDTVFVRTFQNQTISSVAVADLEGDGLNDIIVTTFDSLYVFGTLLKNIIHMTEPIAYADPPTDYCAGDTVNIRWRNVMRGVDRVNIWFQPFEAGLPTGEKLYIVQNYPNNTENGLYEYSADTVVLGREGRFIVESAFASGANYDTTSMLRFEIPSVNIDFIPPNTTFRMGTDFVLTGTAKCVDSLSLEYSLDSQTWTKWTSAEIEPDGTFRAVVEVPCLDIFPCSVRYGDSIVFVQALSHRSIYIDTIATIPVPFLPAWMPITLDPNERACPTRTVTWDTEDLKFTCDNVEISYSIDGGKNFSLISTLPVTAGSYVWDVPYGLPDEVILRVCCENSCVSSDTILTEIQPKYVNIIAPNPFKPLYEDMEVVYIVPGETNVTIRIYDQSNRLVSEPVSNQPRSKGTVYCDRWNGLRTDGSPVANGLYYLSLEFSNGAREIHHVFIRK